MSGSNFNWLKLFVLTLVAFIYKGEHQKQLLVSGENTRLPPVWHWFKSLHQCHMWDEFGVGSSFPPEVLRFSPLLINQDFQILIQPGMVDKEPLGGWARLIPIRYL